MRSLEDFSAKSFIDSKITVDSKNHAPSFRLTEEFILRTPILKPFSEQNPSQKSRDMRLINELALRLSGGEDILFKEYLLKHSQSFSPFFKKEFRTIKGFVLV
jgi:hypothetical protein